MASRTSVRFVVLVAALVLSGAAVWALLSGRRADEARSGTIATVNKRAAIHAELVRRAALGPPIHDPPGTHPASLRLEPLPVEVAELFFPSLSAPGRAFDPLVWCRRLPHEDVPRRLKDIGGLGWRVRTNDRGFREDQDVDLRPHDLRAIVIGDSNVDGVCPNEHSFTNVLERALQRRRPGQLVDALNAGVGAWGPWNALGVLPSHPDLDLNVVIHVVFGGNDPMDAVVLRRWFDRLGPYALGPLSVAIFEELVAEQPALNVMGLMQYNYFHNNRADRALAVETLCAISAELQRRAAARGARFLAVYLPAPLSARPQEFGTFARRAADLAGIELEQLFVDDYLADRWLLHLRNHGIASLDLRPDLRAHPEPVYWPLDMHLNLVGNHVVGSAIAARVESLLAAEDG